MPIEPSSDVGLTISGNSMSWEWSSFPRNDVAK